MRELEFLPSWYSDLSRRRRMLRLQVWLTLVAIVAMVMWMTLVKRNQAVLAATSESLGQQIIQTDSRLREKDRLAALEQELQRQQRIQSQLGRHVESARLLSLIAGCMKDGMALLNFSVDTDEVAVQGGAVARAAIGNTAPTHFTRRLKVRMSGVAPTNQDLSEFITRLNEIRFLNPVTMVYLKDRRQGGHLMREFEIAFEVNLDILQGGQ